MSEDDIRKALPVQYHDIHQWLKLPGIGGPLRWSVHRNRSFFDFGLQSSKKGAVGMVMPFSPGHEIEPHLRGVIHVPGLRGNPERTYKTTAIGPRFPGLFNDYVASIIYEWQRNNAPQLDKLGHALKTLGLTWKVDPRPVDDTRVEIRVGRMGSAIRGGARDVVSIADVGFGVSQTLPVIVALLAARSGQLVYIEQPEIHLHPRAQVDLARLLVEAAARGVRLLVETHSGILILGVQTLVARGEISPDRVKLHWFTRRRTDGTTEIKSADLDDKGSFGDWPEDFGNVTLQVENRYLDAVERRLKKR